MTDAVPRARSREWLGLAVIALPCLLYSMDLTVLNLAVPALSADLGPTSSQLLWIVDVYGFVAAGLLVTMGTLGDRIGRRRLLLYAAAAFGAASVIAAFSSSPEMLIAARALLGAAGAALAPSTLSLIRSMFINPRQRTVAVGVWVSSFSAGAAVGPLVGGALLEFFWWGSVFLVAVPVMALLLVLGPLLLPEYRDPGAGRLDLASAALSLVCVLPVVYGLKALAQDGAGWPPALSVAAGLAFGAVFVRRQRASADPMIDLRLLADRAFGASLVANTLVFFVNFGMLLFFSQYLQLVLGFTPLAAGLWTVPQAVAFIAGSMLTPQVVRRVRPAYAMAGGLAIAAVGFGMFARVDGASGLAMAVAASVIYSFGVAPLTTLATDLMVGTAPPERAGAASSISETSSEFGGALGIAVLGSIASAVYRDRVAGVLPAGVPPEAAVAARDTVGGAVAAAGGLPDPLGAELLGASRTAFTLGLYAAALTSAAIALGVAVLVLLRGVPTVAETPEPPHHEHAGTDPSLGPKGP